MSKDDLQGASPEGTGLSQAEPSGLGPSDFDPSRWAWSGFEPAEIVRRVRCLADDAPDEGDSPAQIWRHACDTILLRMGAFEPAPAIEARRAETQSGSVEDESAVRAAEAPDSIDRLKRKNAELSEALRPFATAADHWPKECPDYILAGEDQHMRVGDLRRARTLLSQSPEGGETA